MNLIKIPKNKEVGIKKDEYYLLFIYKFVKKHYKFFIGLGVGLIMGLIL